MKAPVKLINRENPLQKSYKITMQFGLILSLGISLIVVKMDFNPHKETKMVSNDTQEEVYIEEIVQTKQELKAPAPPRPVVPIEVPNDEVLEDEIINIDAELDLGESFDVPPPPAPKNDEVEEEIFIVVEQPPVLVGGIKSIQERIEYPSMAMSAGIEGRVIVQFTIDKQGRVLNPFVVRGIGGGCDEEAIRAVKEAKFQPGMQRGRAVQVRYTLPITFKLKKSSNS